MKKTLLLMLMLLVTSRAAAQKPSDDFAHRLFEARLAEVCLRLDLTDEVKEKFAPIYEQYCNDMQALRPKQQKPPKMNPDGKDMQKKPGKPHPNGGGMDKPHPKDGGMDKPHRGEADMTDAEKLKGIKDRMEAQHRAQEIRLAYLEKFSTILSDNQLVKFYEVEDDIQRKLHERANMGGHPDKEKNKK